MATQFAKVNLSQIVTSLFPPPAKHVLQKEPPDTLISYGRQVMLHEPSKQLQRQAFQYLVEHLSEELKSQFWIGNERQQEEYVASGSGKNAEERQQQNTIGADGRVKVEAPDVNYRYLFSIDGEPLDWFAQLSHDLKIILLSQKKKFSMIQGIDQYLNRSKVLESREETVRILLKNRGNSWFINNLSDAKERLDENRMIYEEQMRLKEQKQSGQKFRKSKMTPRTLIAVEKERQLVNLAQVDFEKRIGHIGLKNRLIQNQEKLSSIAQNEQEIDKKQLNFDLEESIFAFLQKINFERKLKKWEAKNKRGSLIPQQDESNSPELASPKLSLINIQQFSQQKQSAQQSLRSLSQPKQLKCSKHRAICPSPPDMMLSPQPSRKPGARRITTANPSSQSKQLASNAFQISLLNKPQQDLLIQRKVGFQKIKTEKVKRNSVHMSIDFTSNKMGVHKQIPPIIPTPFNRAAPLLQKNRPETGWCCSLQKYKRVKMTMREMKALGKLVKASRTSPPDSVTALNIVRKTQQQKQQNQTELLIPTQVFSDNRNNQKRGVKFKEIEQFKQEYALSRKDVYAIKSRFMSLEKMSESKMQQNFPAKKRLSQSMQDDSAMVTQMVTTSDEISKAVSGGVSSKKEGISLKNFLKTSPLVKDLDPKVALRLIQALGIDPGNSGQKIDWKHYVELYCILKENNTNKRKLSQFWVKYFDPQSLGIIQVKDMVVMLQDLLKGKSEGAHSWIIHHFSSNFIKRLVIENIIDAEKKLVDLFELEKKFQDEGTMVEPGMLSKAAGQHEFQDVFNELTLNSEQEKVFNYLMADPKNEKQKGQNEQQNKVTFEEISEHQSNSNNKKSQKGEEQNQIQEGIESVSSEIAEDQNKNS